MILIIRLSIRTYIIYAKFISKTFYIEESILCKNTKYHHSQKACFIHSSQRENLNYFKISGIRFFLCCILQDYFPKVLYFAEVFLKLSFESSILICIWKTFMIIKPTIFHSIKLFLYFFSFILIIFLKKS